MVKDIITDERKLCVPSDFPPGDDIELIVQDLIDTANAHKDRCLGLAANQIGYNSRIFVIKTPSAYVAVINPEVVCMTGGRKKYYEACLSRPNKEPIRVKRYKRVKIKLINDKGEEALIEFKGLAARIVQHEMDHLNGVLI
jgi:peptide deformylase